MKNQSKRALSILLMAVMILTSLPGGIFGAMADEGDTEVIGGLGSLEALVSDKIEGEVPTVPETYTVQVFAQREDGTSGGGSITSPASVETSDGAVAVEYAPQAGYYVKRIDVADAAGSRTIEMVGDTQTTVYGIESDATIAVVFAQAQYVNATAVNGAITSVTRDEADPTRYYVAYTPEEGYSFEKAEILLADGDARVLADATAEGVWLTGVTEYTRLSATFKTDIQEVEYRLVAYFPKLESEGGGYTMDVVETAVGVVGKEVAVDPSHFTFEGFTFEEENANNRLSFTLAAGDTNDLVMYFTRNVHVLQYAMSEFSEENPGEVLSVQNVEYGETVVVEEYPEIASDEIGFAGWMTAMGLEIPQEPGEAFKMLDTDITLFAAATNAGKVEFQLCWRVPEGYELQDDAYTASFPADGTFMLRSPEDIMLGCDGRVYTDVKISEGSFELYITDLAADIQYGGGSIKIYENLEVGKTYWIMVRQVSKNFKIEYTDGTTTKTLTNETHVFTPCGKPIKFVKGEKELDIPPVISMYDGEEHSVVVTPPVGASQAQYSSSDDDFSWVSAPIVYRNVTNGAKDVYVKYEDSRYVYTGKTYVLIYSRPIVLEANDHKKTYDRKPYADVGFRDFYDSGSAEFAAAFSRYRDWPRSRQEAVDNGYDPTVNVTDANVIAAIWADYDSKTSSGFALLNGHRYSVARIESKSNPKPVDVDIYVDELVPVENSVTISSGSAPVTSNYYVIRLPGDLIIEEDSTQHYTPDPDPDDPDPGPGPGPTEKDSNFGDTLKFVYDNVKYPRAADISTDDVRNAFIAKGYGDGGIEDLRFSTQWTSRVNYKDRLNDGSLSTSFPYSLFGEVGKHFIYVYVKTKNVVHLGLITIEIVPRPLEIEAEDQVMTYTGSAYPRKSYNSSNLLEGIKPVRLYESVLNDKGTFQGVDYSGILNWPSTETRPFPTGNGNVDGISTVQVYSRTPGLAIGSYIDELWPDAVTYSPTTSATRYRVQLLPGDLTIGKAILDLDVQDNIRYYNDQPITVKIGGEDYPFSSLGSAKIQYSDKNLPEDSADWKDSPYEGDLNYVFPGSEKTVYVRVEEPGGNIVRLGNAKVQILPRTVKLEALGDSYQYNTKTYNDGKGQIEVPTERAVSAAIREVTGASARVMSVLAGDDGLGLLSGHNIAKATIVSREVRLRNGQNGKPFEVLRGTNREVLPYADNLEIQDGSIVVHKAASQDVTAGYIFERINGPLTITPIKVTVTPDDKEIDYGEDPPKWEDDEFEVDGDVIPGDEDIFDKDVVFPDGPPKDVGDHDVNVKPGENPNYDVETGDGTLTIKGRVRYFTNYPKNVQPYSKWTDDWYSDAQLRLELGASFTLEYLTDIQRSDLGKFTSTGLKFLGWKLEGMGSLLSEGTRQQMGKKDLEYWAQWERIVYRLTIQHRDRDNHSIEVAPDTVQNKYYDDPYVAEAVKHARYTPVVQTKSGTMPDSDLVVLLEYVLATPTPSPSPSPSPTARPTTTVRPTATPTTRPTNRPGGGSVATPTIKPSPTATGSGGGSLVITPGSGNDTVNILDETIPLANISGPNVGDCFE